MAVVKKSVVGAIPLWTRMAFHWSSPCLVRISSSKHLTIVPFILGPPGTPEIGPGPRRLRLPSLRWRPARVHAGVTGPSAAGPFGASTRRADDRHVWRG